MTCAQFKAFVEEQGVKDSDLLAWISFDADKWKDWGPERLIVYDFSRSGEKVIEHVDPD
jgi:hypothetical protein